MSRMSELHDDLSTIHSILLGQRQVATLKLAEAKAHTPLDVQHWTGRIECINDLLLEIEAAGVVWPGNVVETLRNNGQFDDLEYD
ncbi:MAG: hypothetical protein [Bacteriophage sp.]|nr:MAG: hypothetical protein [Bacteriophage sp.]